MRMIIFARCLLPGHGDYLLKHREPGYFEFIDDKKERYLKYIILIGFLFSY